MDEASEDADITEKRHSLSVRRRTAARLAAVQTLFQCHASQSPPTKVIPRFKNHFLDDLLAEFEISHLNEDHYQHIIWSAIADMAEIDEKIKSHLRPDWPFERIGGVERAALSAAYIEFRDMADIPAKVVIAEYAAIADSCNGNRQFTQAILDKLAHHHRDAR